MSLNRRQQIDYTQRYQIRSGRVNFVDYVQKRQLIEEGRLVGLNLYPPDLDSSIIPIIQEGETNTTPEELERYLAEVALPNSVPGLRPVPDAPFNLIGTSGDGEVTISFTPGNDNGSPITNYEYIFPDASGATFEPFDPPTGPVSSLIFTGLENGRTYQIQIRAVNVNGPSLATSTFLITPVPGGTNLILFLDGANGGSTITWDDTSGKFNNCALTAAPTYSASNGGYYIFDGSTQFGEVPNGFDDFTAGITIMAFVNFGTGNLWERLIDFGNGTQSNNILISRAGTTTNLAFELYNGVSQPISFSNSLINGIINNQWMFVVARLDGTNYRLGNQNSSNSGASSVLPTNIQRTNNYIGKSNWPGDSLFGGNMGIVAIYKSALTNQQITDFFDLFKNRYFTVSDPPTALTGTAGSGQVSVSFTAPVNTGGLPITSYTVTSSPGGFTATGASSPITVTGLTNGTSYTFTAVATNSIGNSVASAASDPVTPVAPGSIDIIILGNTAVATLAASIQSAKTALGYSTTLNITTQQLQAPYDGANLSSFQVVILYTDGGLSLPSALGTNLNSFVTNGGHLIMASFCWGNVPAISSFTYNSYSTYQFKGTYSSVSMGTANYTVTHPITTGIPTNTGLSSQNIPNPINLTTIPNSQVIATFSPSNTSFIAVGQNGSARLVGINAYVASVWAGGPQNLLKYVCNSIFWCMGLI